MAETLAPAHSTLGGLLVMARRRLSEGGIEEAALEARLIVEAFAGTSRVDAIARPDQLISVERVTAVNEALARRIEGAPVFRILGRRDFHGIGLLLSPETLDPRPDTEALVELVLPPLREMAARHGECRILDLGTGTGAIGLAILADIPEARAIGCDIQTGALETARANAELNGLSERFETRPSDWFGAIEGRFHAIVANPPYIRSSDVRELPREVRDHDPHLALDGGTDGLDAYRLIASGAGAHLEPEGFVAVEIGFDQKASVSELFRDQGFVPVGQASDLGGRDRALMFTLSATVGHAAQKGLGNTSECR